MFWFPLLRPRSLMKEKKSNQGPFSKLFKSTLYEEKNFCWLGDKLIRMLRMSFYSFKASQKRKKNAVWEIKLGETANSLNFNIAALFVSILFNSKPKSVGGQSDILLALSRGLLMSSANGFQDMKFKKLLVFICFESIQTANIYPFNQKTK